MAGRLKTALLIAGLAFTLVACGFVTAPLRHGIARVAQVGVQGADAVIEHNRGSAETADDTASSVAPAASQGLQPVQSVPERQTGATVYPSQRQ